jgi:stage IV sporulation protein FB
VPFIEPEQRTQFDLSWRMFGIHVRVHPLFWLVACILGAGFLEAYGATFLLLWVACVFVSVLIHELGHVLMGRVFGSWGHILLYGFGGLAIGSNDLPRRWQRIAVLFAGPGAGFLLLGLVYLVEWYVQPDLNLEPPARLYVMRGLGMLMMINLWWGVLNLLPIYPLDGGQISWELFTAAAPRRGAQMALGLSFTLAALIALNCILGAYDRSPVPWLPVGGMYTAILFGMLAVENLMMLQQLSAPPSRPWDEDWPSGRR